MADRNDVKTQGDAGEPSAQRGVEARKVLLVTQNEVSLKLQEKLEGGRVAYRRTCNSIQLRSSSGSRALRLLRTPTLSLPHNGVGQLITPIVRFLFVLMLSGGARH